MKQGEVFVAGQEGYHTYRIPSIIVTLEGTLLAFCEGRMFSSADKSPTDLVLKRSLDGGEMWTSMQVVVEGVPHAMMDPCPVVDRSTGRIHLVYDRYPEGFTRDDVGLGMDSATAWVTHSDDDGQTWSVPRDITPTTKRPNWSQVAHGPGRGIQTRSGRLIVPCNSIDAEGQQWAFAIYSDDHGESWEMGSVTGPEMSESQVVELGDGSLLLNIRSYRGRGCRAMAISTDGGESWSHPSDVPDLIEPVCQASILRYEVGPRWGPLLFANPASHHRTQMTVKLSEDGGLTWPKGRQIYPGPSAYSCLAVLPDGGVACLYERGEKGPYETITLAQFSISWLGSSRL